MDGRACGSPATVEADWAGSSNFLEAREGLAMEETAGRRLENCVGDSGEGGRWIVDEQNRESAPAGLTR